PDRRDVPGNHRSLRTHGSSTRGSGTRHHHREPGGAVLLVPAGEAAPRGRLPVSAPVLADAGLQIDNRWLVRHVSIALQPGRFTVLIGPNGSGKSAVLRLLAGLWPPTEGRADLDGRALASLARRDLARRVAVVPQDTHLAFAFTVREAVAMGR